MTTVDDILDALQFDFMRDRQIMGSATGGPGNTARLPRAEGGNDNVITYAFGDPTLPSVVGLSDDYTGWTQLTAKEIARIRQVMDDLERMLDIRFVETSGVPDLDIGKVDLPDSLSNMVTVGRGGLTISSVGDNVIAYSGRVLFDVTLDVADPDEVNVIYHELDHALGLKHPFSNPALPDAEENNKYSVMSYTDNPDTGRPAEGLMLYDIVALQDIWGANLSDDRDTVYDLSQHDGLQVIWDAGGWDRLDGTGRRDNLILDLRQAAFSSIGAKDNLTIAFGSRIEAATGGRGDDLIQGNGQSNDLRGQAGADWLIGEGGQDRLAGGLGADQLSGGVGRDMLNGGKGNDRLSGQGGHDALTGGGGADLLLGGAGKDRLEGGAGKDRLVGGAGQDMLTGGGGADVFVFGVSSGRDVIRDFQIGLDRIDLSGVTQDPLQDARQSDAAVVVTLGQGHEIRLQGTSLDEMSLSDFIL